MVSGGTYGTEDIIHGAGYGRGILLLLLTPLLWSLPTAYMIGELSSALPAEGGYYAWVRRAMGNFWGFQEAWLSLVASIFDMAIYPTLFVAYLTRLVPWFAVGHRGWIVALGVVTVCALMNIAGIRVVAISSLWLFFLLSAPFVMIVLIAPLKIGALTGAVTPPTTSDVGLDRRPAYLHVELHGLGQRVHDRGGGEAAAEDISARDARGGGGGFAHVHAAVRGDVADGRVGVGVRDGFVGGLGRNDGRPARWAAVARGFRVALVLGGMMSAFGMFNALVMSYSRLPLAMAQDGMLPSVFGKLQAKTRAPWVAITFLAACWALCLGLGFERLVTIDVLLYGMSLLSSSSL